MGQSGLNKIEVLQIKCEIWLDLINDGKTKQFDFSTSTKSRRFKFYYG